MRHGQGIGKTYCSSFGPQLFGEEGCRLPSCRPWTKFWYYWPTFLATCVTTMIWRHSQKPLRDGWQLIRHMHRLWQRHRTTKKVSPLIHEKSRFSSLSSCTYVSGNLSHTPADGSLNSHGIASRPTGTSMRSLPPTGRQYHRAVVCGKWVFKTRIYSFTPWVFFKFREIWNYRAVYFHLLN